MRLRRLGDLFLLVLAVSGLWACVIRKERPDARTSVPSPTLPNPVLPMPQIPPPPPQLDPTPGQPMPTPMTPSSSPESPAPQTPPVTLPE